MTQRNRETTTVEVKLDTWRELNNSRQNPGESMDDIIRRAFGMGEREDDAVDAPESLDIEEQVRSADWSATNYACTDARVAALVAALQHLRENGTATTPELVDILEEELGNGGNTQRLLSDVSKQLEIVESPPSGSNRYTWAGDE